VSPSAIINGVSTPLSGYNVLARSGWADNNGNVLGRLLVRDVLHCRTLCAQPGGLVGLLSLSC
jgi:hypothetical protein